MKIGTALMQAFPHFKALVEGSHVSRSDDRLARALD
jgi:hypothetical protein